MASHEPLTTQEFERVLRIKADANQLFGAGECQRALDGWTAALQVYGDRYGSPEQRFEKGKLHSNKAEAALKLELYDVAVVFATESLACNPVDNKARFRRARALLGRGGFEDLMQAQPTLVPEFEPEPEPEAEPEPEPEPYPEPEPGPGAGGRAGDQEERRHARRGGGSPAAHGQG